MADDDTYGPVLLGPKDKEPMPEPLRRSILSAGELFAESASPADRALAKSLATMFIANALLDTPWQIHKRGAPNAGHFLNRLCSYLEAHPEPKRLPKAQALHEASSPPADRDLETAFDADWTVARAIWPLRRFIHAIWRRHVDRDSGRFEMNYLCRLTVAALVPPEPVDYPTARAQLEKSGSARHEAVRRTRPHREHGALVEEVFLRRARILDSYKPKGSPERALRSVIRTAVNALKNLPIEIDGKEYSSSAVRKRRDKSAAEAAQEIDESNSYARKHRHHDTRTAGELVEEIVASYRVSETKVYARIRALRASGTLHAPKPAPHKENRFGPEDVAIIRSAFESSLRREEVLVRELAAQLVQRLGVGQRRATAYVTEASSRIRLPLRQTELGWAVPTVEGANQIVSWVQRQRLR